MTTAERFRDFAATAIRLGSPLYADWASEIAVDDEILRVIDRARPGQRQPVLVFAVSRMLGAEEGPYALWRTWLRRHEGEFLAELDVRLTQTNDVRRVAPVSLALAEAGFTKPVSLLEVGAAGGLGLYPDRYAVVVHEPHREGRIVGDPLSRVRIDVTVAGREAGAQDPRLPEIRGRAGLDLAPLDVGLAEDVRWLETLLWPGQDDRVRLLRSAIDVARRDPAPIDRGDAVDGLDALVDRALPGTTPVVITAGTLVYLPGLRRQAFVDEVARLGVRWISYERTGVLGGIQASLDGLASRSDGSAGSSADFATLALDGRAIATGDAHGTRMSWLRPGPLSD